MLRAPPAHLRSEIGDGVLAGVHAAREGRDAAGDVCLHTVEPAHQLLEHRCHRGRLRSRSLFLIVGAMRVAWHTCN